MKTIPSHDGMFRTSNFWKSAVWLILPVLLLAAVGCRAVAEPPPAQSPAEFAFTNGVLTIRTDRYVVTWQDGCLTQLATRHNGGRALTVGTNAMSTHCLPNGMGSFHEQEKAGKAQHRALWSHDLKKGPPSFPAQHPPTAESQTTCVPVQDGVRLTYAGLSGDPSAKLIQELTVEPGTGDLVIRQRAESDHPGVFGIGFSLLNLDRDIAFALPYFSGVRIGGSSDRRASASGWAWPGFWSAGLIVGEIPGGGSFMVFADDPKLGPKYLKRYALDHVQGLGFEACGQYPYSDRKQIEVCAWRFNTFAGSWMEPAERYKQWLASAYGCKPRSERSPAWFNDIALYVPSILNSNALQCLGNRIAPRHILMNAYGWAKGFNRNAPFYQPLDTNLAATAAGIHALGSRYGVYVSHKLIDRHAHPGLARQYGCLPGGDALSGDAAILDDLRDPDKEIVPEDASKYKDNYLMGIHSGSDTWIEFYSDLMVKFHEQYAIDVFYQDCAGSNYGSSGLIDGRSIHEGMVACEKRIREKLPQTATIGEHWNEVVVAAGMELGSGSYHSWFSPEHHRWLGDSAHPLLGYIFGAYTDLVMYKTPMLSTEQFHRDQNFLEVTGSIPTWRGDVATDNGEARVVILRAKLFADGYAPDYPAVWEPEAVAYLRDRQGRVVKYLRRGGSTFCYREEGGRDRLYYARITGRNACPMPEPVHIVGWNAYDRQGPIGLAPNRWYALFPGAPEPAPLTFTHLPEAVWFNGTRTHNDYVLADLGGTGTGELEVLTTHPLAGQEKPGRSQHAVVAPGSLLLPFREAPEIEVGKVLPLDQWTLQEVVNGLVTGPASWWRKPADWKLGDVSHRAFSMEPPSGRGAEISADGYLRLPADPRTALAFSMGRLGGIGDGVHFVVRVNGREIWRAFSAGGKRSWTPVVVPLGAYAGQSILLSLAIDCGPSSFNTSNDQSFWGDPKIILQTPTDTTQP